MRHAFISHFCLGLIIWMTSLGVPAAPLSHATGAPTPAAAGATPAPSAAQPALLAQLARPAASAGQPVAPDDIAARAVADQDTLQGLAAAGAADPATVLAAQDVQQLGDLVTRFLAYTRQTLASHPGLETLRSINLNWHKVTARLDDRDQQLSTRATLLNNRRSQVEQLLNTWQQALAQVRSAHGDSAQRQQVTGVINQARQVEQAIDRQRASLLDLQDQIGVQKARINDMLAAVQQARATTLDKLLEAGQPPLWQDNPAGMLEKSHHAFTSQFTVLTRYITRHPQNFLFHGGLIVLLAAFLLWGRRRLRQHLHEDAASRHAILIFDAPVATAVVLSVLASTWIYPFAPRLWHAVLGAVALVPTVLLLRRLLARPLLPVLHALVVFYLVDQLRTVIDSMELLSRLVFLGEMLGGFVFLAGLTFRLRTTETGQARLGPLPGLHSTAKGIMAFFAVAFVANLLGYVGLGNYLGDAVLKTSYLAVILYALVKTADGLVITALHLKPLTLLAMVQRHRVLIRQRLHRLLVWAGTAFWVYVSLDILSLRVQLMHQAGAALSAGVDIGPMHLSLANLLAFTLSVWGAFLVSRFIRFLLEEDVYPRVSLASGLPYACSTLLHYSILLAGFIVALDELGFDMGKVTILAGAFGVGVGFGLQNIINNFVSGIILLFERPIKVGDTIQIDGQSGVVQHIGIRASVFRTADGSEIILPNSKLIADQVTNWTHSNRQRRVTVNVGVAHGTDLGQALAILKEAANADHRLSDTHAPEALCVEFALETVRLELRVWTEQIEEWVQIRSDLAVAINAALLKAGIALRATA
jgi:potassium-dependent mechanosensitive channel